MKNKFFLISVVAMLVVYCKGAIGLLSSNVAERNFFLQFTALNIFATTILTLLHHKKWNLKFIFSIIFIILFGFFIEVLGTKTGVVFGEYYYGKTLSIKLLNVPIVIGVNWLLLVYAISCILNKIKHSFIFAFCAAFVMTFLDFFIEPVAIKLDFWQWKNNYIPLQNYIAWYIISFILFYFVRFLNDKLENKFASFVIILQFIFFITLNILLK